MLAPAILLVLAILFLGLAAHPFVFYPASLRMIARRRAAEPAPAAGPVQAPRRFALCVSAYNEAACIERKVENMLELRRAVGELDILVYVDGASDRTAEL